MESRDQYLALYGMFPFHSIRCNQLKLTALDSRVRTRTDVLPTRSRMATAAVLKWHY